MAAASLAVRISAQIAEFQKSFNDAGKTLNKFAGEFEGIATRAAAVGTFFGNLATDIAKSLASGFAGAIRDAVKFSSEFSNAFIGLSSVARAFGTNTDAATVAAKRLSADGLLPLKDSATGLKNLLAAGFNLPQATKLMEAFKDSAAFGRQGALSFGDAVRSATEGVKNGNSILVDNAGITKNLSQILKEAGFSAQDLSRASSDASVRMALYNGILKEATAQTGDANKLTQTFNGTLVGMRTSWTNLLATWGDAITQNKTVATALGAVRDAFNRLNGFLSDNQRGYLLVSDAIIGFVKVSAFVVRAINTMQTAFNTIDSALVGVAQGVLKAVNVITTSLVDLVNIAAKLPGGSAAIGLMSSEIASLLVVSDKTAKGIAALSTRINENTARQKAWDSTLSGVSSSLDGLVKQLEATRGQTVQLGAETGNTVNQVNNLGTAAEKNTKKIKDFLAASHFDVNVGVTGALPGELSGKRLQNLLLSGVPTEAPTIPFKVGLAGALTQGITGKDLQNMLLPAKLDFWQTIFNPVDAGKAMASAISGAIQGGGNIIKAAAGAFGQHFTTGLAQYLTSSVAEGGKAISGWIGGAINAVLPGIGSLFGPLLGKIGSGLKNLFGFGTAGRDAVKTFAGSFGGFDALHAKLLDLGAAGEQLWINLTQGVGRNNPDQAKAAIDAINKAFETQADRVSKTQAVLDEYGITFEQTGEKFRNTTLATAFDALFEKTQILKDAGVDYNLILEKQAGAYSELAARAIATGSEIPASMRPILEQLEAMGLLTDKATGEFIDLGNVKWATTLTEGFKSVTDAIDRLTSALTTGVGGALDYLSRKTVKIPISFDVDSLPGGVPALASGGIVTRRTLALVGESGPEAVVPLSQFNKTRQQQIRGDVYMSGRLVGETVFQEMGGLAALYGVPR